MRILWVSTQFLHPTTRGGQIRTLEMLRCMQRRHEICYVGFENPNEPEGPRRAGEYSNGSFALQNHVPKKGSAHFYLQALASVFSRRPVIVSRYHSQNAQEFLASLLRKERFDRIVCDFLTPSSFLPAMEEAVLFQHNVETAIWDRYVLNARDPFRRAYFALQAKRLRQYEADVCRRAAHVVAVSEGDAALFRSEYGAENVSWVGTGVDVEYFRPTGDQQPQTDLVFVGSMDWMPNDDGMRWMLDSVMPIIWRSRPDCSVVVVGRNPSARLIAAGKTDNRVTVTGTVPDVRPYLWNARAAVVPLRIGGGTRLKIFESMAAQVPVLSTAIGCEGLPVSKGDEIVVADSAEDFAAEALKLLSEDGRRSRIAANAYALVTSKFTWEQVALDFERILDSL